MENRNTNTDSQDGEELGSSTSFTAVDEAPLPEVGPSHLLRLPLELRLQIYYYLIPRKRIIEADETHAPWTIPKDYNMLVVSRGNSKTVDPVVTSYDSETSIARMDEDVLATALRNYDMGEWHPESDKSKKIKSDSGGNINILLLSKQISEEALNVLYGENYFAINIYLDGEYNLKHSFTAANRQRVRSLLLIFAYRRPIVPDDELWESVLPKVKGLRVIIEQPVKEGRGWYGVPTFEQEIRNWGKWLAAYLRCFNENLSPEALLEIDDDGQPKTQEMLRKHLAIGYRSVRCRFGDHFSKRGLWSWEKRGPWTWQKRESWFCTMEYWDDLRGQEIME